MIRLLFAFILVFGVGTLTFFLWQKQVSQYNFSFEQKENISRSFQEAVKDFQENLAPFDEAFERLEAIDWSELATSTLEQSTTTVESATSSEETAK